MSRAVWKYEVEVRDRASSVDMPRGAVIVHVAHQGPAAVTFWAEVDRDACVETRVFEVVGTGYSIRAGLRYVGTTLPMPELVWHLYEVPEEPDGTPFQMRSRHSVVPGW